jgi:hypothetical protein
MNCIRGLPEVVEARQKAWLKVVEVGGPGINFDYAHFLPHRRNAAYCTAIHRCCM